MTSLIPFQTGQGNAIRGAWLAHLEKQVSADQISPATATTYAIGLARLISWGAGNPEPTRTVILDWLGELRKQYSPATCNTWLYGVRSFFQWGISQGLIDSDPTAGVRAIKTRLSGHKRHSLSNLEVNRLLSQGGARDRAILHTLAFSGCRGAELVSADLADLSYSGSTIQIRVQGKGSRDKGEIIILAAQQAQDALSAWLTERGGEDGPLFWSQSRRNRKSRLSLRSLRKIVKDAYRQAGIVGKLKTTHSLRHSAITAAIRNGAAIQDVQAMARHRSASTTMNYYHHESRLENPAESRIQYC